MAHQVINNVVIKGISTCVPSNSELNIDYPYFQDGEAEKVILSTGIRKRHIASFETTAGDLCYQAAEDLLNNLKWDKKDIDCLIFVSQSQDYILPATSCVLQGRLGLPVTCACLDISYGCSGWIYGMQVLASMITNGYMKRGLLLVGDTPSKFKNPKDKTAWPLFGDAGSATALEYNPEAPSIYFSLFSDGEKFRSIIIPEGGCRKPFSKDSLVEKELGDGIVRRGIDSVMDGMNVFSFGMTRAPEVVEDVLKLSGLQMDEIDLFFFHQANMFLNEKIRKKLKIPKEKVPYSLEEYGNTSCTTIPLTIDTNFGNPNELNGKKFAATAFGVGLSWGALITEFKNLEYLSISEYV